MARSLHGVGMEEDARFFADCTDLCDRQDRADLVVGVHDGHEAGVRADGCLDLLGGDGADLADRQQLDLKALFFELFQRVQHSMVLKRGGNDVLFALLRAEPRGGDDGLIVGLAAAGGEVNFARLTAETGCDGLARRLKRLRGLLADGMQARGIAVDVRQTRQHRVERDLAGLCRGGVVRIYKHGMTSLGYGRRRAWPQPPKT